MKSLFICSIILLALQLNARQLFSQNDGQEVYENYVTFNITRLLLLEARFGYERLITEKHVLRTAVGLQFPVSSNTFGSIASYAPYYYAVSKGIYLGLGYNYLIIPESYFYVSAEVYYSYNYYDDKYYKYCVSDRSESYVINQSLKLAKTGIKFLVGKKATMAPWKKTRMQFDFFGGMGVQYRSEHITIFKRIDETCDINFPHNITNYDPQKEDMSDRWVLTLHAGILLSLAF